MNPTSSKKAVQIATTAWTALGMLGILPAIFSVKMLNAPGAIENKGTIALVASLGSFPIVCLAAVLMSQRAIKSEKYRRAFLWACLPLVNIVVGGLVLAWMNFAQGAKVAG